MNERQHMDINTIAHVVDTWEAFDQWCTVKETSPAIAYMIMALAHDAIEAERIWQGPTDDEKDRIVVNAKDMASGAVLHWGEGTF